MEDNKENTTISTRNEQFRPGSDPERSGRNQIFTQNMVSRRNQLQYTQKKLSDLTGIKLRTIQNYEKGSRPKGDNAIAIAKALKCSLDWLLLGEGPEPPDPGEEKQETESAEVGQALPVPGPEVEYKTVKTEEFKLSDALTMTARVLESGTSYAKALFLNIQHFDMALKSEARISELEHKQKQLFTEINLLKKQISDLKKRSCEKEELEKESTKDDENPGIAENAA